MDRRDHQRDHQFHSLRDAQQGLSLDEVLKEAQRLGYAEADPTFDVEGIDAAHKLTIMSAIAFGNSMKFDQAYIEGITKLDATPISSMPNNWGTASSSWCYPAHSICEDVWSLNTVQQLAQLNVESVWS